MSNQMYKSFWDEALKQIHEEYIKNGQEDEFQIWFNMNYIENTVNEILVSVPSEFMWDRMISMGYVQSVQNKLIELIGQNIVIKPTIRKTVPVFTESDPVKQETVQYVPNPVSSTQTQTQIQQTVSPSVTQTVPVTMAPADTNVQPVMSIQTTAKVLKQHPSLNLDYTFDKFVASDSNVLAYNASLAAAKNPGKSYNPILIYGGVGLGKTHLMQSIGNYIYNENSENLKICYITAENFTNEFLLAIRNQTTNKFKEKYRNLDVLLLDDIHFIKEKDRTQEELFYTFEALYQKKAQMVFTCDRPISELKGIEDRLKSRFGRGMTIDLKLPDYESRFAIIQKKLDIAGKTLPQEFIDYIAKNVQTNIRDIEASIVKITAFQDLVQRPLNMEIVQNLIKDTISYQPTGSVSIDSIQKVVAEYYNISISDLKGKRKNKKFAIPRHIAVYIARTLGEYSYDQIGEEFGGRDHTTMLHSYERIVDDLKTDSVLNSTIKHLLEKIKEIHK